MGIKFDLSDDFLVLTQATYKQLLNQQKSQQIEEMDFNYIESILNKLNELTSSNVELILASSFELTSSSVHLNC